MRAFIVLCLIALASAQYNYNQGETQSLGPAGGSDNFDDGAATFDSPNYGGGDAGTDKEFYTFSANEDDFHDPASSNRYANTLKKNLRVLFIKGPENHGLEDAALALAKNAANQKTAVYVLHKQTDLDDLASKFNNLRKDANQKPEVHFVKYRTPEDAANAQRQIQGEYDRLGGSSQSINGGVAPAINFASKAPVRQGGNGGNNGNGGFGSNNGFGGNDGGVSATSPGTSYLPASILRRLRYRVRY